MTLFHVVVSGAMRHPSKPRVTAAYRHSPAQQFWNIHEYSPTNCIGRDLVQYMQSRMLVSKLVATCQSPREQVLSNVFKATQLGQTLHLQRFILRSCMDS